MADVDLTDSDVDIIVPCYNYGRFLCECVRSALDQDGLRVRILIIDDHSPDDTAEVGAALAQTESRVEFRRHADNQGHIATYNEGLDWARGTYLILLSADDLLVPGALKSAVRFLNEHPDIGLLYGRAIKFWGNSKLVYPDAHTTPVFNIVEGGSFIESICRSNENPIASPAAAIVRTSVQKTVGYYRPDLPHTGDREMWMRLAARSSVAVTNSAIGLYRQHDANMSSNYYGVPILAIEQQALAYEIFFQQYVNGDDRLSGLGQVALDVVGRGALNEASRALDRGDRAAADRYLELASRIAPSEWADSIGRRIRLKRALWRLLPLIRPLLTLARRDRMPVASGSKADRAR